ncbi:MAG: TIGR04282 family arsenosugar biosynthesis glycosyltransferase [Cycloclasticus sp.]|nr:TIGR04282 family arsenosugar biosynthesis glycosyltransferase [Cycloclasticus sp.]
MSQMLSKLLQIFAKAPVLGQVKTRLAVNIGEQKARDIYQALLASTVKNTHSTAWQTQLWCAPDTSNPYLQSLGKEYAMQLQTQPKGGIGERMLFALQAGLARAEKVVLIGSDCPVITQAYISAAFNALDKSDVVFGPVEDGGYVLVGCKKVDEQMFTNVKWSCAQTLKQNVAAIEKVGLKYERLTTLWDIDTANDLRRWVE